MERARTRSIYSSVRKEGVGGGVPVRVRWGVGEVVAGHCQWRDEPGTYPPPLTTLTRPKSTKTNSSFGKRPDLDPVSFFLLQLPSLFV